jgi:AraC-like DNA-binding protein
MSVQLFSRYHLPIILSNDAPSHLADILINRAEKWYAIDDGNEFLFQEIKGNGFTIRIRSIVFRKKGIYFIKCPTSPYFQLSLFPTARYDLTGFTSPIVLTHRRFNLFFSPEICFVHDLNFTETTCLTFELWLDVPFLLSIGDNYPHVMSFIQSVANGCPTKLYSYNQLATTEIMSLIDVIILNAQDLDADPRWIEVYVREVLDRSFSIRIMKRQKTLNSDTIRRLYSTVDLVTDMDDIESQVNLVAGIMEMNPKDLMKDVTNVSSVFDSNFWTLNDLAEFAGMSRYAFQKAFKDLYGCTINAYTRQLNWQSALNMVITRSTNLKRIASFTGFSSHRSFSRAFKREFGMSPKNYAQLFQRKFRKYER